MKLFYLLFDVLAAQSLEIAAQWAATAVQFHSSIPPAFEVVKQQWGIDLIP
jgi:hypothetical protein